jgi:hypothetical protein
VADSEGLTPDRLRSIISTATLDDRVGDTREVCMKGSTPNGPMEQSSAAWLLHRRTTCEHCVDRVGAMFDSHTKQPES